MLGLTEDRPTWADAPNRPGWVDALFHERAAQKARKLPDELAFMNEAPGRADEAKAQGHPLFVKSAGRGASLWKLSDGSEFKGTKDEATEAEASLSNVHETWE